MSSKVAEAQSFKLGGETRLTLTPQSPQAEKPFKVRVEAYSYNLARARISWSINGSIREEFAGEQEITLTAPKLGIPLTIKVTVAEELGTTHTATETITPSSLDLIVESDTRIPHFYRGRALPSPGSKVRLIAFPSIYASNGSVVDPRSFLYTWRVNTKVAKTGRGMNTLNMEMPRSGPLLIEITLESMDGTIHYSTIEQINAVEPHNIFYEDNPLHGLSQNALPSEFTLVEDEISIRAEPYFVSQDIFNTVKYEWKLGGMPIINPNADPQTLTLRKTGSTGSARVEFSIRNLKSLLQAASSAFTVYFEG